MRAWVLKKHGAAHGAFALENRPDPTPGPEEVRIRAEAFGLNFADVMARRGLYRDAPPLPAVLGYETVGQIDAVGTAVNFLHPGQRVVAFTRFGGYADTVVVPALAALPLSATADAAEATALATQYGTAYYCAEEMVRLHPGDKVLIQAAAGGVGTALVQLAKRRGAVVFGTAGSEKKLEYLRTLGVDHPINYRKEEFYAAVQKTLGKDRLDVVFDNLGGKAFRQARALLGSGGRMVYYGVASRVGGSGGLFANLKLAWQTGLPHPLQHLIKSQGLIGVNMLRIGDNKPLVLRRVLEEVVRLYETGELKPTVGARYPHTQLAEAHAHLEGRASIGKVAVLWDA